MPKRSARRNPAGWRGLAVNKFEALADKASDDYATPKSPMDLSYGDGFYEGFRIAAKLTKKASSPRELQEALVHAAQLAAQKYEAAESENDPEGMAYFDGLDTALSESEGTLIKLSRGKTFRAAVRGG